MTAKLCSINGCERTQLCRGWCSRHYRRWRKHGDPTAGETWRGAPMEFLRAAVSAETDDCILWPYMTAPGGYPKVMHEGKSRTATQLVLQLSGKPRPSRKHFALHAPVICHTPQCINKRHLRWGTEKENTQDRNLDGTGMRGEDSPCAKLTESDVVQILLSPEKHTVLADKYGVTHYAISNVKRRKTWRHVNAKAYYLERLRHGT